MQKTFETKDKSQTAAYMKNYLPLSHYLWNIPHTLFHLGLWLLLSHNQACFSSMACKAFKMISEALSPKEEPIPQKSNRLAKKFWFWPPLAIAFVFSSVCFFCFAFLHQMPRCKSNIPVVVVRRICSNEEVVCVNFGETYLNAKKEKQLLDIAKNTEYHYTLPKHFILFYQKRKVKNKQIFYK